MGLADSQLEGHDSCPGSVHAWSWAGNLNVRNSASHQQVGWALRVFGAWPQVLKSSSCRSAEALVGLPLGISLGILSVS